MSVLIEEKRAESVMAKRHTDRLYVFDLFGNGVLVTSRAPEEHSLRSENIQDYLSPVTWQEVRAHLLSYSPSPMVVDSRLGVGVVMPTLAPASSLGVLCVSSLPRDRVIRLARSGLCGEFAAASSTVDVRLRMGKRTMALLPDLEAWTKELSESLGELVLPSVNEACEPIDALLYRRVARLSSYVGVPVTFLDGDEIMNVGDFDFPLFAALVLLSLCFARRVSLDRSACVRLQMTGFGGTCRVDMRVPESLCAEQQQELITMRAIAERKNMPFDYAMAEGMLSIRFSPATKDWSYLELKTPSCSDQLLP